ncbi:SDR family oxidoreductase [Streptomyces rimosus]|uniref:SDR family oxidoreductase n=1 Tax=Streptomyces rimosus TaxID=1927 RepID=UPI0005192132|nr:SDR family oxidoreductase [Streptomyces rimosus]
MAGGKRILITGAGSGFGRDAALRLAERGHHVIAAAENRPQMTGLIEEADRRGIGLQVENLDITDALHRSQAHTWDVDVLFNNAAVGEMGPLAEIPLELVRRVFEVNVFGHLALAQGFARQMVERGNGRIVWLSSIAGLTTNPYLGPYCASKYAIESIAQAMHDELKPLGVQVCTINPGPYRTGFNDRMGDALRVWFDRDKSISAEHFTTDLGVEVRLADDYGEMTGESQKDPEEIVELFVKVAEGESGLFRNFLPADRIEEVKRQQAAIWDLRQ